MDKDTAKTQRLVTPEMLQNLPEPVRRYLEYSGIVGTPWIDTVHLKQTGTFRQGADRPWMPLVAEEFYTTDPPSLIWDARFKVAGLPLIRAKDQYEVGHGHMFGKLAGLFTVFDVRGEELDQATMMRYLNEVMWFPTAFLGDNMTWQEVDDHSAEVTFTDCGRSVSARMFFDDEGRLTNFTAMRYREIDGQFSLDAWSTPITEYGVRAGLNLPVRGQAVWNLPGGDLPYADLEIRDVEYNVTG
jgi:hypothetical protein